MRAHCVDCGLPTFGMDIRTGVERCLPCKKKKLGREPREFTTEEVREHVLDHIWGMIQYWHDEERNPTARQKLEGLAFSMLVMLDGGSGDIPGFIVTPTGDKDDEKFHREHAEDWYPYNSEKTENAITCDIGGGLHDEFHKRRPKGLPKEERTDDERPEPIRPPSVNTPLDTLTMNAMSEVFNHLQGTVNDFAMKTWPSITRYLLESTSKYHSGIFGDVKVMVASGTGAAMVTLWRAGKELMVSGVITNLNEIVACQLNYISGSAEEVRDLVKTVVKNWNPDKLKRDDALGLAYKKREKDINDLYSDKGK